MKSSIKRLIDTLVDRIGLSGFMYIVAAIFAAFGHEYVCLWFFVCAVVVSIVEINSEKSISE